MKRRGFLGFLGGAAVAGPGMVKEAAAKAAADLSLGRAGVVANGLSGLAPMPGQTAAAGGIGNMIDQITRGKNMLAKLRKLSASDRARYKNNQTVYAIDPDIAAYRSIALWAKIDWQRERQLDRIIAERKTWWQRLASGGELYEDGPL